MGHKTVEQHLRLLSRSPSSRIWTRASTVALVALLLAAGGLLGVSSLPGNSRASESRLRVLRAGAGASQEARDPGVQQPAAELLREQILRAVKRRASRDCYGNPAAGTRQPRFREATAENADAPVTLRTLALRIDFQTDRTGSLTTTADGRFDLRVNTPLFIDPPPHNRAYFVSHLEAVSRYFSAASFGKIVLEYDVFPRASDSAFHLSDTADYGPWTFTQADYALAERLITDAVIMADLSSEPIDFSQYDIVIIFHAGADLQGDINGDSPYDIPSFSASLGEPIPVDNSSSYVYAAMVIPETVSQDGLTGAINGVITHEMGHMLGLTDLYNTEDFLPAIGYWSLMDTGNYLGGFVENPSTGGYVYVFGLIPGGLDPWSRKYLGDVWGLSLQDEIEVGASWSDSLRAVELGSPVLKVPASATEYFLIENRQSELDGNGTIIVNTDTLTGVVLGPESNEYDALLPGAGILIWHIDEALIEERALRGMTPNGGLLERGVDVEEADGVEDLGDPSSWDWLGSEFDPFFVGNATQFNPTSVPNSRANSGGLSGVFASVGSPRQTAMYVSVERKWAREGWPVAAGSTAGISPAFGDFDEDGVMEVFFAGPDSTVRAFRADGTSYVTGASRGRIAGTSGGMMPVLCYSENLKALFGTVRHGDSGAVYGWAVNDVYSPLSAGDVLAGWPPEIGSATTPPCAVGDDVIVGCDDGRVRGLSLSGSVRWVSGMQLGSAVKGTLACGDVDGDGGYDVVFATDSVVAGATSASGEPLFGPFSLSEPNPAGLDGPFLALADIDVRPDSSLEVVVVTGAGRVYALNSGGALLSGWPVALGDTVTSWPACADVDGDGCAEVIVLTKSGKLFLINGSGSVSTGWPLAAKTFEPSGESGVLACDLDGGGATDVMFVSGGAKISAVNAGGVLLAGWPLAFGPAAGGMALCDVDDDGRCELFGAAVDSMLLCVRLPYADAGCAWPVAGGNSGRTNCLETRGSFSPAGGERIVSRGLIETYPNPSRGLGTTVAFTLSEAASVTVEMFDLSGRSVYRDRKECGPNENSFLWIHGRVPPGVYVIRVEAQAGGRKDVAFGRASVLH
ncbi:MAG: T9SS type A sorting domain-containing protein [Candidatus Eisenbacteria bacterium]